jgi:hypothetical protein
VTSSLRIGGRTEGGKAHGVAAGMLGGVAGAVGGTCRDGGATILDGLSEEQARMFMDAFPEAMPLSAASVAR